MRFPRVNIWRLMVVVAAVAVVVGFNISLWRSDELAEFKKGLVFGDSADLTRDYGDFTKTPLAQSPYLRDVVESIRLVSGARNAGSDNDWLAITFVDARDVRREAMYAFYVYAGNDLHEKTLLLGQKPVTPGGPEEHAFLGLMQRWYRRDAEAQGFHDHLLRSDLRILTKQQNAKVMGAGILITILNRK